MADLTFLQVKDIIKPFARRVLDRDSFDNFTDEEFVSMCNEVADDINEEAELYVERFNYLTTAADVSGSVVNYEVQRKISKVYRFLYKIALWENQKWSYLNDVIVLNTAPTGIGIEMDIEYLGKVVPLDDAASDTDTIDLPDYAHKAFLALLRVRMKVQLLGSPETEYMAMLEAQRIRLRSRRPRMALQGASIKPFSFYQDDREKYDFTDRWVSNDSVTTLDSGEIVFQ